MSYSSTGLLALILHLLINRLPLKFQKNTDVLFNRNQDEVSRYRSFLWVVTLYYISDILWGILYEHHDVDALFPFLYSVTVFYFIFMFMSLLMWLRYIAAYLDKRHRKSRILLCTVWVMFIAGLIYLMVNRFHPVIFSFNEHHEYVAESGRHIAYMLQGVIYFVTSLYLLINASKATGKEKTRYVAVALSCLIIEVFQILQIVDAFMPYYAIGLLIGTAVIHSFVQEGEKQEIATYDNIARSLAADYEAIYYIDIKTGEFREYSASKEYASLNVPSEGKDFYKETRANVVRYAHPDDVEFAKSLYYKKTMLKNLQGKKSFSYKYRIMVGGTARFFRFTVMMADKGKHFLLFVKDIDEEITAESVRLENQKNSVTFTQIAESLAYNYDELYYVDMKGGDYISYESNDRQGKLRIRQIGDDFFGEAVNNIEKIVHKNDRDAVADFINKDNLISAFERKKGTSIDYRLIQDGQTGYYRLLARKASDNAHFILCVENINDEIAKEKNALRVLNNEKKLARRDELTGVKNKTAYKELERSVQANIDNGMDYLPFALLVADANNLKKINDTEGHVAGDEYIKASANLLKDIFSNSPVFRVGGDEFVVFLRADDYIERKVLVDKLHNVVLENQKNGSGPVLAAGVSEYIPGEDSLVTDIFDRADRNMYENKQKLKERVSIR
ncbi:diguanylate cyclase (GGDEF) domain-containing protein [Lachnospiraceae bacterium XPB1003]|nr:diguanylate cyclase (GGDEF) domain-containing protein [Lachnospiraceae bacterium XPB1003]